MFQRSDVSNRQSLAVWDPTREKRLKIKEVLEKEIPEIQAHVGGMTSIDILPKDFNKAAACSSPTAASAMATF